MRSEGKFYDDKNFPRGFNRSGVFTITEARLLEDYGRTMRGLYDGTLTPVSNSEHQFIAAIHGELNIQSDYAKCWLKYINKTSNKVRSYTLCESQRKPVSRFEDDSNDSDSDTDLDY
ncbi:DUF413 domain-containing protein [Photobacterium sp. J15]|uniref:DUF413 domain-containing protein n=1 Tax=Photobacterium sp. J15 TaxID=265901 RepID=UPI0007E4ACE0|nr:DUF413 domain-containing protein [Photobacterium sp. J15]